MTKLFEPPPTHSDPFIKTPESNVPKFNPIWLGWFIKLVQWINSNGGGSGTIDHNLLSNLQGGTTSEYYHLTNARYSTLTGAALANIVLAGPVSGGSAVSTFRALITADMPVGTGTVTSVIAGTGLSGGTITTTGTIAIASTIVAGGPTGAAATVPVITYNAQGQLTAVTTAAITPAAIGAPAGSGSSTGTNTGDQTITLTSEATGTGVGSFAVTLTNSAVIGKVITGYVSGAGTVAATDSILQAIQKLNGNISASGVTSVSATAPVTSTGGATPSIGMVNQGTATTILHGNAAGNPTFSAVSMTADVSGILPEANGGTNQTTFTQQMGVSLGATKTIPLGYCIVSSSPFDILGTVDIFGTLELL